jgi:hypothetical protein
MVLSEEMMRKLLLVLSLVFVFSLLLVSVVQASTDQGNACWGQASAVFAQTEDMGGHASELPTPRLGLRNLARALADDGIIPDDSMQSLGVFVANELGLSIDACQ